MLGLVLLASGCGTATTAAPIDEASCEEIRLFADRVVDIGITYDYEPTKSPADLAKRADVVVLGVLTGHTTLVDADDDSSPNPFVGYELLVRDVVTGGPLAAETVDVFVEFNPADADISEFESATVPGVPVLAFGSEHPQLGESSLVAHVVEGLMTACDGGPPLGWVGTEGEWAGLDSLPAVIRSVRG